MARLEAPAGGGVQCSVRSGNFEFWMMNGGAEGAEDECLWQKQVYLRR